MARVRLRDCARVEDKGGYSLSWPGGAGSGADMSWYLEGGGCFGASVSSPAAPLLTPLNDNDSSGQFAHDLPQTSKNPNGPDSLESTILVACTYCNTNG